MQRAILFFLLIACLVTSSPCLAGEPSREYQIKGGFLYKFIFFTEWPQTLPGDTITIGILGENPFGDLFKSVEDKPVQGKKLVIRHFPENTSVELFRECQILFISSSQEEQLPDIIESLKQYPVVTVGESERFVELGGMIRFVTKQDQVRFEINEGAATRVGVTFRSKLLRVAVQVIED
ncbi:MAG: YfiR family protein [Pseudomonadota bacterium]